MKRYKLIIEDKEGKIVSISPFYNEQTLCYAMDNEISLDKHNFHVVEDVTGKFGDVDGYWRKIDN